MHPDESAGLCGFGMTQHPQWGNNIVKCHATINTCNVYQKMNSEYGGTCGDFCKGFDLECKNGWKDIEDYHCDKGEAFGCDERDGFTTDHICECGVPNDCEPIPKRIIKKTSCEEEIELPEFYNVPMPDWTLAYISEKCQLCVSEKDISCKNNPWVPSGNACVHHAITSCKESCNDLPDFPKDIFTPISQDVCLTKDATMGVCGPDNQLTLHRLHGGAVQVLNEREECLTAGIDFVEFKACHKKHAVAQEWHLESVL